MLGNDEPRTQRIMPDPDTPGPLFLHLKYNPSDPSPHKLQSVFKDTIVQPKGKDHISQVNTYNKYQGKADFDRAIICYSSQKCLGDLLSPRKHRFGDDFSVADFYTANIASNDDE